MPTLSGVLQVSSGVFKCFQVFSGVLQVLSKLVFFGDLSISGVLQVFSGVFRCPSGVVEACFLR